MGKTIKNDKYFCLIGTQRQGRLQAPRTRLEMLTYCRDGHIPIAKAGTAAPDFL
jgi:hypothetical protein